MPFIEDKFPDFDGFAKASVEDIFSATKLEQASHFKANEFRTGWALSQADGTYAFEALPVLAQAFPVMGTVIRDLDGNGWADIVLIGNLFDTEVETPRYDAGNGLVLLQVAPSKDNKQSTFTPQYWKDSGFYTPMNVKSMLEVEGKQGKALVVANNNFVVQVFK